ncbi:hypothetical protein C8R44DRAFT_382337 [Mycena epipterygia]|nr:hypothetical protein C8R44DRAFT_382337 [Mycena epipterygia]
MAWDFDGMHPIEEAISRDGRCPPDEAVFDTRLPPPPWSRSRPCIDPPRSARTHRLASPRPAPHRSRLRAGTLPPPTICFLVDLFVWSVSSQDRPRGSKRVPSPRTGRSRPYPTASVERGRRRRAMALPTWNISTRLVYRRCSVRRLSSPARILITQYGAYVHPVKPPEASDACGSRDSVVVVVERLCLYLWRRARAPSCASPPHPSPAPTFSHLLLPLELSPGHTPAALIAVAASAPLHRPLHTLIASRP